MTSSIKIGLIGIAVAGLGLGTYYVKHNLKTGDNIAKVQENSNLADNASTKSDPSKLADESKPPVTPAQALSTITPVQDKNSEHVASPASVGLRDTRDEADRSWRPRPMETTEALPVVPNPLVTEPPARTIDKPAGAEFGSNVTEPVTPAASDIDTAPKPTNVTLAETPHTTNTPPATGRLTLEPTTRPSGTANKPPVTTLTAPEKMTVHVVQAGDTFSSLAGKYLGSVKYTSLIAKANPKINPNKLYVGAKLNIPAAPTAVEKTATKPDVVSADKPKVVAPPVDPANAYTIKRGDKWEDLGKRFLGDKGAWTMLYEMNRERFPGNSRTLKPGMVIEIPAKPATTTTATERTTRH